MKIKRFDKERLWHALAMLASYALTIAVIAAIVQAQLANATNAESAPLITATPTSSPIPPTATGIRNCYVSVASATTTCALPEIYNYRFELYNGCGNYGYSATIYLEAAQDISGPWSPISQLTITTYGNVIEGSLREAIPAQYGWYRIRVSGRILVSPFEGQTESTRICSRPPLCPPSWNHKAPYPISIENHAMAAQGEYLYSFGGNNSSYVPQTAAYRYSPATDAWASIASLPAARHGASAVSEGGYVYIVNGANSSGNNTNVVYRYDPVSNTYAVLPPGLLPTSDQAAVFLDGRLYRIGGSIPTSPYATNTVEIYGEQFVAPLPIPLKAHVTVALNGYIYVAAGLNGNNSSLKTYRYDPASNTWDDAAIADLPVRRSYATSAILNGKWVLAGSLYSETRNSVISWDPATNTWSSLTPMSYGHALAEAGVVGDSLYVVGGRTGGSPLPHSEEYSSVGCTTATGTPTMTATATPTATPTPTATGTNTSTSTSTSTSTGTTVPGNTQTVTAVLSATATPSTSIPTSTSTGTNTSTSTSTAVVPTAHATSTTCAIAFTDVRQGHTFYTSVQCLACRGTISGYSDGTFRSDNLVTRGQFAKIVSNAGAFTESPGPQIFEDVPPNHTFYEWINRLTNREYMSGYACGSPGEPCVNNRAYFRPFANATRGQTSKIVANAARIETNIPPNQQTFEDVPLSHPFWLWIERLASRGVMGGYQCGTVPEEQCVPPLNRAYFRPYNNVTRGQSAKIVAQTFFPGCAQSR